MTDSTEAPDASPGQPDVVPARAVNNERAGRRVGPWGRAKRRVFGYDAFISYAHKDGLGYAMALENRLKEASWTIFRDAQEMPYGSRLEDSISHGLRRSRMLIVIDTIGARASNFVGSEIEEFDSGAATVGRRPIIAIRIAEGCSPWPAVERHLFVREAATQLALLQPSESVFEAIEGARTFRLVQRLAAALLVVLATIVLGSLIGLVLQYRAALNAASQERLAKNAATQRLVGVYVDRVEQALRESDALAGLPWAVASVGALERSDADEHLAREARIRASEVMRASPRIVQRHLARKKASVLGFVRGALVTSMDDDIHVVDDSRGSERLVRGLGELRETQFDSAGVGLLVGWVTFDSKSIMHSHYQRIGINDDVNPPVFALSDVQRIHVLPGAMQALVAFENLDDRSVAAVSLDDGRIIWREAGHYDPTASERWRVSQDEQRLLMSDASSWKLLDTATGKVTRLPESIASPDCVVELEFGSVGLTALCGDRLVTMDSVGATPRVLELDPIDSQGIRSFTVDARVDTLLLAVNPFGRGPTDLLWMERSTGKIKYRRHLPGQGYVNLDWRWPMVSYYDGSRVGVYVPSNYLTPFEQSVPRGSGVELITEDLAIVQTTEFESSQPGTGRVVDIDDGAVRFPPIPRPGTMSYDPQSGRLATSLANEVRVWENPTVVAREELAQTAGAIHVSPSGRFLLLQEGNDPDWTLTLYDTVAKAAMGPSVPASAPLADARVTDVGRVAVLLRPWDRHHNATDATALVWEIVDDAATSVQGNRAWITTDARVAVGGEGAPLVVYGFDGVPGDANYAQEAAVIQLDAAGSSVVSVTGGRDGFRRVGGGPGPWEQGLQLRNLAGFVDPYFSLTGIELTGDVTLHGALGIERKIFDDLGYITARLAPAGDRLLVAGRNEEGHVFQQVWDVATLTAVGPPIVGDAVPDSDFSRFLWRRANDSHLRLWSVAEGTYVGPPMRHDDIARGKFSGDDAYVITYAAGFVRLWSAATGHPITIPRKVEGGILDVAFLEASSELAVLVESKMVLFPIAVAEESPEKLEAMLADIAGVAVDASGELRLVDAPVSAVAGPEE